MAIRSAAKTTTIDNDVQNVERRYKIFSGGRVLIQIWGTVVLIFENYLYKRVTLAFTFQITHKGTDEQY